MPVWLFCLVVIAVLGLAGVVVRFLTYGDVDPYHVLFSFFFSMNLLVSYWEICLYFRRDYIEGRSEFWRDWQRRQQRSPVWEFLRQKATFDSAFSPSFWADIWASYSLYDESYADRRSFGFTCDIGNGFVTPLPTLVLYATFAVPFMPAVVAGMIGAMVFWQWVYVTSGYWVSFFVAKRHRQLRPWEAFAHVHWANSLWLLLPLLGMYVSVRLILDGNYAVLGHG